MERIPFSEVHTTFVTIYPLPVTQEQEEVEEKERLKGEEKEELNGKRWRGVGAEIGTEGEEQKGKRGNTSSLQNKKDLYSNAYIIIIH